MKGNSLVSVIIPAYNAAGLVRETVQSVLDQKYGPIEIILVDDGSKDDTQEVVADLVRSGKIIYIHQENQGQAVARRNGFAASHGKYISFIDADDLIAPEKIQIQVEYLEAHPECGVCYSDIYFFWHHAPEVLLRKRTKYYSGYIFDKLISENNFIQVMTALVRRDVLQKIGMPEAKYRRSDDWILWLNIARQNVQFCFLNKVLSFQRRQRGGTLSDQKSYFKETAETNIAIYEDLKRELSPEKALKYDIDALINFWQFRRVLGYLILGDRASAKMALNEFKMSSPQNAIKKIAVVILISVLTGRFLGWAIFWAREWRRRHSFIPVRGSSVRIPVARSAEA